MTTPITVRTVSDLRTHLAKWRKTSESVALVPTMGALHQGHLSLVVLAKTKCDHVVASIFVNPMQFGPREDFETYPRDEASDLDKLATAGADLVFIPDTAEMYPQDFSTHVKVSDLTEDLCGAARPNHFEGVATVVASSCCNASPTSPSSARRTISSCWSSGGWCAISTCRSRSLAGRSCARATGSRCHRGTPISG
jgi:pantoate--beta-alanine ligase